MHLSSKSTFYSFKEQSSSSPLNINIMSVGGHLHWFDAFLFENAATIKTELQVYFKCIKVHLLVFYPFNIQLFISNLYFIKALPFKNCSKMSSRHTMVPLPKPQNSMNLMFPSSSHYPIPQTILPS